MLDESLALDLLKGKRTLKEVQDTLAYYEKVALGLAIWGKNTGLSVSQVRAWYEALVTSPDVDDMEIKVLDTLRWLEGLANKD